MSVNTHVSSLTGYRDTHKLEGFQWFLQEGTWNISPTANISRVCTFKTDGWCLDNSKDASLVPLWVWTGRFDTVVSVSAGSSEKPQIQESGRPGKGRHAPLSQRSNLQPRGVPGRVQCGPLPCVLWQTSTCSLIYSLCALYKITSMRIPFSSPPLFTYMGVFLDSPSSLPPLFFTQQPFLIPTHPNTHHWGYIRCQGHPFFPFYTVILFVTLHRYTRTPLSSSLCSRVPGRRSPRMKRVMTTAKRRMTMRMNQRRRVIHSCGL